MLLYNCTDGGPLNSNIKSLREGLLFLWAIKIDSDSHSDSQEEEDEEEEEEEENCKCL